MVKWYHKLLITASYKFNSCSDNTMLLSLMDMTPDYESGDKGSIPLGAIYWSIDKLVKSLDFESRVCWFESSYSS